MTAWPDLEHGPYRCAHCHRPISGDWYIETAGHRYHSALYYRGPDLRRCRDVAVTLAYR